MSKRWCGDVNSTSERNYQTFNKLQAKSIFGRHVGGQEYALQHVGRSPPNEVGQYKTTLLINESAIKYLP